MKVLPILIIYAIVLGIAAVAVKELNQCTVELQKHKEHSHE